MVNDTDDESRVSRTTEDRSRIALPVSSLVGIDTMGVRSSQTEVVRKADEREAAEMLRRLAGVLATMEGMDLLPARGRQRPRGG